MTNYTRGRTKEYAVKKDLESQNYSVMRTAGSHGDWDLIAFQHEGPLHLIQIKYTKEGIPTKNELSRFEAAPIPNGARAYLLGFKKGQSDPFRVYKRICGTPSGTSLRSRDDEAWLYTE
jgi:hypothetical protein